MNKNELGKTAFVSILFILLWIWLSFSSCATTTPKLKPLMVTFWKNGMPLDLRGEADSLVVQGKTFLFVFYPDSDVVNGREKIQF